LVGLLLIPQQREHREQNRQVKQVQAERHARKAVRGVGKKRRDAGMQTRDAPQVNGKGGSDQDRKSVV